MSPPTGHKDRQPANHGGGDKGQHMASLVLLRWHEQGIGGKTHPAANEQNDLNAETPQ